MLDYLRDFNMASVVLRLGLAMLCGGVIGLERGKKRRVAGLRTYMLVALGATLTMLLGEYICQMMVLWQAEFPENFSPPLDVSRLGAQVINGIGFLGAGTVIINTDKQQVKGLTTAAGLWASGCMGLAIGAGYYECALLAVLLIFLCMRVLRHVEGRLMDNSRNINLYIEFGSMDDVGRIIMALKAQEAQIYDVELRHNHREPQLNPSAVISLRLKERMSHARLIASMMDLDGVRGIEEV